MNIALLHYSYAPVIGGVELILEQHARLFAEHGHSVTVLCGRGESADPRIQLEQIPELDSSHPLTRAAQLELDRGELGPKSEELEESLATRLEAATEGLDNLFIHNVLTMPFNLCCTAALWRLAQRPGRRARFVGWIHDIAAANPDYAMPHLTRPPWNLLTAAGPGIEYVAVSEHRKRAFHTVTGSQCEVIPNGVDPVELLDLTPSVAELVAKEKLLSKDIVLLHPARILKRKNIELGMRTAAELAARGRQCRYLVTGAPDAHNPASLAYAESLRELRTESVLFLNERFGVTRRDLVSLYRVADVLFFPSRQEGFGLPLLEAAVCGLPIFCADVEPMRSMWGRPGPEGKPAVTFFDPDIDPGELAGRLIHFCNEAPLLRNRRFALREHSWDNIHARYLRPLLARAKKGT